MTDPAERPGAALSDRYRIEREIGRGGMAVVYLARDLKYDRPVAVKGSHRGDLRRSIDLDVHVGREGLYPLGRRGPHGPRPSAFIWAFWPS